MELLDAIESKRDYAVHKLRELVQIPTVVPPGENYLKIVKFLGKELGSFCDVEEVVMPEGIFREKQRRGRETLRGERANLRATMDTAADETVVLYTHLDVVPVDTTWSYPPFEGVIENEKMYGRGVSDSKAAVAALLTTLNCMDELGIEPAYNLNIALTTDEEVGPYSGLCYFADEGLLAGDYFLCMDGSSDDICIGSNGVISWKVRIHGKSCHSGRSFLGVNAIEKAKEVMDELMKLKKEVEKRESSLAMSTPIREISGFEHVKPVLNLCMIKGGIKNNIVPGECILEGDRRFIPEEKLEDVVKELEESLAKIKVDFEWSWRFGYPPMLTDREHPWVKRVQKIASQVKGKKRELVGTQGSLDVAYAVQRTKQPVACFGVGRVLESNAHGSNENIRIRDLMDYAKFLGLLLTVNKTFYLEE